MLFSVPLLDKQKHQLLQSWEYFEPVNEEERLYGSPPGGRGRKWGPFRRAPVRSPELALKSLSISDQIPSEHTITTCLGPAGHEMGDSEEQNLTGKARNYPIERQCSCSRLGEQ